MRNETLRSIRSALRKQKVSLRIGSNYHQVGWGLRARQLAKERMASQCLKSGSVFSDVGLTASRVIACPGLTLASRRWHELAPLDDSALSEFIALIARQAQSFTRTRCWASCFPAQDLASFRDAVEPEMWDFLMTELDGLELPATGAHGDLTPGNIGVDAGTGMPIVFDWEAFDPNGSVVADLGKLSLFMELTLHRKYRISELTVLPRVRRTADLVEVTAGQLALLGLLSLSLMERPWISISERARKISL